MSKMTWQLFEALPAMRAVMHNCVALSYLHRLLPSSASVTPGPSPRGDMCGALHMKLSTEMCHSIRKMGFSTHDAYPSSRYSSPHLLSSTCFSSRRHCRFGMVWILQRRMTRMRSDVMQVRNASGKRCPCAGVQSLMARCRRAEKQAGAAHEGSSAVGLLPHPWKPRHTRLS